MNRPSLLAASMSRSSSSIGSFSTRTKARVSRWTYRMCWLGIFMIHALVIGYCSLVAWLYGWLPDTYLDQTFQYVRLGLGTEYHKTVGRIHLLAMLPHAITITNMVLSSLWCRRLVFSVPRKSAPKKMHSKAAVSSSKRGKHHRLRKLLDFAYLHLVSSEGIFGVEHKHFDDVLFLRELFETGFQTYHGWRMSWYLPRLWLNRGFVALLIVNCWSTALAQILIHGNETKKRLTCLLCDSLLDLVCSVGIPSIVMYSYWLLYDPLDQGFAEALWYDDTFLVQVVGELQLVLVSSWFDLLSRVSFVFGLYSSLDNIKELIRPISTRVRHQTPHGPPQPAHTKVTDASAGPGVTLVRAPSPPLPTVDTRHRVRTTHLQGAVFGVWGLLAVIFHLHAESLADAPNCLLQVRPWGITRPACSLVQTHCVHANITGAADDVADLWAPVEASVVLRLVVRHCPALDVPAYIQQFSHLSGLKIYNSTVVQWGSHAELHAAFHKELMFVQLIRVDFAGGELPLGLLATPFPPKLYDLEFCVTNLVRLPDELDQRWHEGSTIYVEYSLLTEYPETMIRLQPKHIGFGGNPIRSLPAGAFESPHVVYIGFGDTLIQELPPNVTVQSPALSGIILTSTNISYWYKWVEDLLFEDNVYYTFYAGDTPYCTEMEEIYYGNRSNFSVTMSPRPGADLSELLMDSFVDEYYVYCGYFSPAFYPYQLEDATYGIQ